MSILKIQIKTKSLEASKHTQWYQSRIVFYCGIYKREWQGYSTQRICHLKRMNILIHLRLNSTRDRKIAHNLEVISQLKDYCLHCNKINSRVRIFQSYKLKVRNLAALDLLLWYKNKHRQTRLILHFMKSQFLRDKTQISSITLEDLCNFFSLLGR